ncbi:MAG: hypothetical protein Q9204_001816 [Flavoplaca sp. TL-2023a]
MRAIKQIGYPASIKHDAHKLKAYLANLDKDALLRLVVRLYKVAKVAADQAEKQSDWLEGIVTAYTDLDPLVTSQCDETLKQLMREELQPKYMELLLYQGKISFAITEAIFPAEDEWSDVEDEWSDAPSSPHDSDAPSSSQDNHDTGAEDAADTNGGTGHEVTGLDEADEKGEADEKDEWESAWSELMDELDDEHA